MSRTTATTTEAGKTYTYSVVVEPALDDLREIISALEHNGFSLRNQSGNHQRHRHLDGGA
jgi:hypothetical protein